MLMPMLLIAPPLPLPLPYFRLRHADCRMLTPLLIAIRRQLPHARLLMPATFFHAAISIFRLPYAAFARALRRRHFRYAMPPPFAMP